MIRTKIVSKQKPGFHQENCVSDIAIFVHCSIDDEGLMEYVNEANSHPDSCHRLSSKILFHIGNKSWSQELRSWPRFPSKLGGLTSSAISQEKGGGPQPSSRC